MIIKPRQLSAIAFIELTPEGPCRVCWDDGMMQWFAVESELIERTGITAEQLAAWGEGKAARTEPPNKDAAGVGATSRAK